MEKMLDILWFKIVAGVKHLTLAMDHILSPLNVLGPVPVILLLVVLTVVITKTFSRFYTTKRYRQLQKEFNHWYELRQEAMAAEDREKGKALAKNIDKAELNKVYYDYFFEGFLNNILTTYLPILVVAAYVNEAFRPEKLIQKFGQGYVLKFIKTGGEPVMVGALFFFIVSLMLAYLGWYIVGGQLKKHFNKGK